MGESPKEAKKTGMPKRAKQTATVKVYAKRPTANRRKRRESPDEAILRAVNECYPQWVQKGLLKKPA